MQRFEKVGQAFLPDQNKSSINKTKSHNAIKKDFIKQTRREDVCIQFGISIYILNQECITRFCKAAFPFRVAGQAAQEFTT